MLKIFLFLLFSFMPISAHLAYFVNSSDRSKEFINKKGFVVGLGIASLIGLVFIVVTQENDNFSPLFSIFSFLY